MSTLRTIAKNFLSLSAASILGKLLTLFLVTYAARVLQVDCFGQWNFALTVASYFGVLANLGLETYGSLELARDRNRLKELVSLILPLKLLGALLGLAAVGIVAMLLPKPVNVRLLAVLCYLPFAMGAWNLTWVFIGLERLEFMAIAQTLEQLVNVAAVLFLVHGPEQLLWMPIATTIGAGVSSGCMLTGLFRKLGRVRYRVHVQQAKAALAKSLPIAVTGILSQVYFNFDTVMLGLMRTDREVGWYNAAYKLLAPLITLRFNVIYSLNPTFSRLFAQAPHEMEREANRVIRLCLYVALPVGVGGMILAGPIVRLLYGEAYAPASRALAILSWSIVCLLLNLICLIVLYASGRQKIVMKITGTAVGLNILLNLFFIPTWGIVGAAAATVTTDLVSLISLLIVARHNLWTQLLETIPKPVLSAALMGIVLWWLREMPFLVNVVLGASLYAAGLLVSGAMSLQEISQLKHVFAKKP